MKEEKIKLLIKEGMSFAPNFRKNFGSPFSFCNIKFSPHQIFCLKILWTHSNLSMSELAAKLGVVSQQLTKIVDTLAENNLVERYTDPANRRVVQVKLSKHGEEILTQIESSVTAQLSTTLSNLTEEEIDDCLMHVKEIKKILSKLKDSD